MKQFFHIVFGLIACCVPLLAMFIYQNCQTLQNNEIGGFVTGISAAMLSVYLFYVSDIFC